MCRLYRFTVSALSMFLVAGCVSAPVKPLTSGEHTFGQEGDEKKLIQNADKADEELRRRGVVSHDAQLTPISAESRNA